MKPIRKLIIRRKSSINAMALKFRLLLDNSPAGLLANGGEVEIEMDANAHVLTFVPTVPLARAPKPLQIPAGYASRSAVVQMDNSNPFRLGMAAWIAELVQDAASARQEALDVYMGFLMLIAAGNGDKSLACKMQLFRDQGYDLHVDYIFGERAVHVSPREMKADCFSGEAFDISLREITSGIVEEITMQERLAMAEDLSAMLKHAPGAAGLKAECFGTAVHLSLA